jgi:hypothetical protein
MPRNGWTPLTGRWLRWRLLWRRLGGIPQRVTVPYRVLCLLLEGE